MDARKIVGDSWAEIIGEEFTKPYMKNISRIVRYHRQRYNVAPAPDKVMRAFHETPYEKVKVVIIGQDPYPTPGHADGLAFSAGQGDVNNVLDIPRSLQNIFKEIERDVGNKFVLYQHPDLGRWARQGVLLLNTALTVVEHHPGSHANIGWDQFVRTVVNKLNKKDNQLVYLLWGKHAQTFIPYIKRHHEYLTASHPSPHSAHISFLGCGHFSNCNEILKLSNQEPINWTHDDKM